MPSDLYTASMDRRHLQEVKLVAQGYRVPEGTASKYLAVSGGTAGDVSRALVRVNTKALEFFNELPLRYPLDLMVAARSVERACGWAAEYIYPKELHRATPSDGLFEPDVSLKWSDVLDMVSQIPTSVEPSSIARLLRDGQWSGHFPVSNALAVLQDDIGWEYLLALSLD